MSNKPKWGELIPVKVSDTDEPEAVFYFSSKNRAVHNVYNTLDIDKFPNGKISYCWVNMVQNEFGAYVKIPVMIAKGPNVTKDSKVLGLTAALHGDELQGIPVIHTVFREIGKILNELSGVIIGIPCVNVTGYKRRDRKYIDGVDLNRIMPGKEHGTVSQQYCFNLMKKVIKNFDYLLDLHTASKGRVNSLYIRADIKDPLVSRLSHIFNPSIIVNNSAKKTTLRGAAMNLGIPTICIEIGDPLAFEDLKIKRAIKGILNIINYLNFVENKIELPNDLQTIDTKTHVCSRSYWIYTSHGGLLTIHPKLCEKVKKGQVIASIVNIFGMIVAEYESPEDGIIVGKAESPIARQGDRIVHLGVIYEGKEDDVPLNYEDEDD